MENKRLIELSKEAMGKAYAPYSGYKVGAALLTKQGKVYQGCNVENAAYTPSNCAERTAIFNAISEGDRDFEAIAIVGGKDGLVKDRFPPCGVCRQVLMEFCDPETFRIVLAKDKGEYEEYTLKKLFPVSFGKDQI